MKAEVVDLEAGADALHVPLPPSLPESRAATPSHISADFSNQTQSLDEKDGSVRTGINSEKASTRKTVDTERRSVAESNHSARPSQKPAESLYSFQLASPPASVGTRVSTRQGSHVSLAQSHQSNPRTVSPVPTVPEPAEKPPVIQELRHELIDSAPDLDDESESGWAAIAKSINDVDEQKIRDHKEDIDTILVFAGLYSAVLSALLAISITALQPDQTRMMVLLLGQLVTQTHTYTITNGFVNSTTPPMNVTQVISGAFSPTLAAKRVNILWFASLTLSLISASFGILVKQWLREYLSGDQVSPQARLRIRHFRQPGLEHWHVYGIAAALPLVLQISLALFFVGLCFFTLDADTSVGYTTIPLVGGWALLFVAATFAPSVSPRCPYKTPLLKSVMKILRFLLFRTIKLIKGLPDLPINKSDWDLTAQWTWRSLAYNEEDAATDHRLDVKILAAVDKTQTDDQLVIKMCRALHETHTAPEVLVGFVYELISFRLNCKLQDQPRPFDLEGLSVQTCTVLMDTIAGILKREIKRYPPSAVIVWSDWMKDCMALLTARLPCLLSDTATETLTLCFNADQSERSQGVIDLLLDGVPREDLHARCLHLEERLRGAFMHLNSWQVLDTVHILLRDTCCTCSKRCTTIRAIYDTHKEETPAVLLEHTWELCTEYMLVQLKKGAVWGEWHRETMSVLCHFFLNDKKSATWRDRLKELARALVVQPKYAPHIYRHLYHRADYDSEVEGVCADTFLNLPEKEAALTNLDDVFFKYVDDCLKKPYLLDNDFYLNILIFIAGQFPLMQIIVDGNSQGVIIPRYLVTYRLIMQTAHVALSSFHAKKRTPDSSQIDMAKKILEKLDPLDQLWLRYTYNTSDTKYDPETEFVEWAKDFSSELSFLDDAIVRDIAAFIPDDEARLFRRVKRLRWLDGKEDMEPAPVILDQRQLAIAEDEADHADGNGPGDDAEDVVVEEGTAEESVAGVEEAKSDEAQDGSTDVRSEASGDHENVDGNGDSQHGDQEHVDGDTENHHTEQDTESTAVQDPQEHPDDASHGQTQDNTHESQDDADPPSDEPPDGREPDGRGGDEAQGTSHGYELRDNEAPDDDSPQRTEGDVPATGAQDKDVNEQHEPIVKTNESHKREFEPDIGPAEHGG